MNERDKVFTAATHNLLIWVLLAWKLGTNPLLSYEDRLYCRQVKAKNKKFRSIFRERLSLSFAKKCLKHEKFSSMFPKNLSDTTIKIRNREKYFVNQARTERFRNSSIPFLQRKLNESAKQERKQLKALLQVNCVSHVDPITFRK